jgi:hypothetical protein
MSWSDGVTAKIVPRMAGPSPIRWSNVVGNSERSDCRHLRRPLTERRLRSRKTRYAH